MTDKIHEMMQSDDIEMVNLGVAVLVLTEPDFQKVTSIVRDNIQGYLSIIPNEKEKSIEVFRPNMISIINMVSAISGTWTYSNTAVVSAMGASSAISVNNCYTSVI